MLEWRKTLIACLPCYICSRRPATALCPTHQRVNRSATRPLGQPSSGENEASMNKEPSAPVATEKRHRLSSADPVPGPRHADPDADPDHPDHHVLPGARARPAGVLARHRRHRLRHRPGVHGASGRALDRPRQRRHGQPDRLRRWCSSPASVLGLAAIGGASRRLQRALGFGHMFCMAGHQMLAVRSGGARSRETALGYYMVAASVGQGFGPFVVGWLGGSAAVPPTGQAVRDRPRHRGGERARRTPGAAGPHDRRHHDSGDFIPIGQLFKLRGFPAVMLSSVVTVTSLDLLVIYLPVLGADRQIDSDQSVPVDRPLGGVAGLARVLCPADLRHRPHAAHAREHARQRRGLPGAAIPLSLPAMYGVLEHPGLRHGHCVDADHLGGRYLAPAEAAAPRSRCG